MSLSIKIVEICEPERPNTGFCGALRDQLAGCGSICGRLCLLGSCTIERREEWETEIESFGETHFEMIK